MTTNPGAFGADRMTQAVDELRAATDADLVAGGAVDGARLTLTHLSGAQSASLRHLQIQPGHGVGGKVLALGRPLWVVDYYAAKGITHHHDAAVRAENIRSIVAVPVRGPSGVAAVLYAGMRQPMAMGDRLLDRAAEVARRLEVDSAVEAEVDRRIAALQMGTPGPEASSRDQCLRDVHAELALLRGRAHGELQDRLGRVLDRVAAVMDSSSVDRRPAIRLTGRQLDVLVQVATGASNAEAADRLGMSSTTVKSHLQDASRRLGARNRTEAIAIARRAGLLP